MDAKALFNVKIKEIEDIFLKDDRIGPYFLSCGERLDIFSSCIIAESITNNRDAICQSIDALTRAIKESGQ